MGTFLLENNSSEPGERIIRYYIFFDFGKDLSSQCHQSIDLLEGSSCQQGQGVGGILPPPPRGQLEICGSIFGGRKCFDAGI